MKFALIALALMVACASAASIFDVSLDNHWADFKKHHGKSYKSSEEETTRRLTWESNLRYIQQHNLEASNGKHTYTLKMNKFGDMTVSEFVRVMNGFNMTKTMKPSVDRPVYMKPSNVKIPDSVDWRTQGYVTPVGDQGQCGSCWAFAALAALEGQHFKSTGKLIPLSVQNLIDCSTNFGNQGCCGGLMDQAFAYIKANKGVDTNASYPYEAVDNTCRFKAANVGATDTGFTDIKAGSEDDLTNAIATVGPIAVAMDGNHQSFMYYESGIYSEPDCDPTQLSHSPTAIGYGSLGQDQDFYIMKNSWGTGWGENGYFRIARNKNNMCGIASMASYPLV